MADDGKEVQSASTTHGADWEVVSLTKSTYAAAAAHAPSPEGLVQYGDRKEREFDRDENVHESPDTIFMSGHFVFPPSEHENLPIEPEFNEIHDEPEVQYFSPVEEGDGGSDEFHEGFTMNKSEYDPQEILFFDNGSIRSVHDVNFQEGSTGIAEPDDASQEDLDSLNKHTNTNEEDTFDGSGLPCEAWWKKHASCFYRNAKDANTFWSVFVAAALMGLVIFGKRWQQEKWHLQQLKWKLNVNGERLSRLLGPISRFKDVLAAGHHRSPLIHD